MSMTPDDVAKYKHLYIETARKYLNDLRESIALLQKEESPQVIKTAHIAAHSLASQSMMIGYTDMAQISSSIEKIFKEQEEGAGDLSLATLEQIGKDVQRMLKLIDEL